MTVVCYHCQKDTGLETASAVFRSSECPHCSSDLRCCRMCRFYDPKSYNECRETQAERVTDKQKANFCGFFVLASTDHASQAKDDFFNAAASLFKK